MASVREAGDERGRILAEARSAAGQRGLAEADERFLLLGVLAQRSATVTRTLHRANVDAAHLLRTVYSALPAELKSGLPGNYVLLSMSARGVLRRATEAAWMAGIGSPTALYVLDALLARVRKQLAQLLERASVERREVRRVLNEILPESRRSMPTPKWAIETAAIDERDYRWIRKIRMGERAEALMGEGRGGESRVARRISASKRAEAKLRQANLSWVEQLVDRLVTER